MSGSEILVWELLGTAVLTLLGLGVVANVVLSRTYGHGSDWAVIALGWGFAVLAGASIAAPSGGHINPAVTLGVAMQGGVPWRDVPWYVTGQVAGGFLGAVAAWLTYKLQFDQNEDNSGTLVIFCTAPLIRSRWWNGVTELMGTFVLVLGVLTVPAENSALGYAFVAFLVVGIGCSLSGPTGYAINPARDLGPRAAYALLPIRGKAPADWGYAIVPVLGPLAGGVLASGLVAALPGS